MGKKIGYIRVSTDKQNLDLQKDALKAEGCYKIFKDVASGAKADRPGLQACLEYIREGDTLIVWKSDRLGRSTVDMLKIIDELNSKNIGFKSISESLFDTTSSDGKLMIGLFALLAEHERNRIRERVNAGLVAARARGRNGGRPKALSEEKKKIAFNALQDRETRVKDIAEALEVSPATIYRYQDELKKAGKIKWMTKK